MECVLDRPFQFAKRAVRGAILCTGEDGKVDGGWMQQCGRGDSLVRHLQHRTWSQVTRCDVRVLTVSFCPLAHSTISARHGRVMVSRKPRGSGPRHGAATAVEKRRSATLVGVSDVSAVVENEMMCAGGSFPCARAARLACGIVGTGR